ncbi:MAG: hypothetical protein ACE361_26445 [Aureliella sp.]
MSNSKLTSAATLLRFTPRELVFLCVTVAALIAFWLVLDARKKPHNEAGTLSLDEHFFASALEESIEKEQATYASGQFFGNSALKSVSIAAKESTSAAKIVKVWRDALPREVAKIGTNVKDRLDEFGQSDGNSLCFTWETRHKKAIILVWLLEERVPRHLFYDLEYVFGIYIEEK